MPRFQKITLSNITDLPANISEAVPTSQLELTQFSTSRVMKLTDISVFL